MNDTHGETGKGWYGFDLDGTLAKYDGWMGIDHIGEPVKPMVELMKRMHDEGKVVKIMTARIAPRKLEDGTVGEQFTWLTPRPSSNPDARYTATQYILDWCEEVAHLGFVPEVVYQKDHLMLELYDDRVKQVVTNTGEVVEEQRDELARLVAEKPGKVVAVVHATDVVDVRGWTKFLCLLTGVVLGMTAFVFLDGWLNAASVGEKERHLHEALHEYMEELTHERVHSAVGQAFDAVAP